MALIPSFQIILDLEKKLAVHEANLKNEKLVAVGELTSRISHDLRSPLSVIKNTIEIIKLRNPDWDKQARADLARIERAVTRMTYQIDDILESVKPKNLELKNSSILDILRSSLDRIIIPDTVKVNLPQNDVNISCDHNKMEVVFSNLIINAIQAMSNNGQINIRFADKTDHIIIEVEDTGIGIRDDLLPKIFDPLFTTKPDGTGLGLPSCKNIVERHGGTIDVKSIVGKGTTFVIKLPKPIKTI